VIDDGTALAWGEGRVDELAIVDPDAQQLARFFVDLMLTMAEGGVEGAESVEAVGALWHGTQDRPSRVGAELDAATLVLGLGAVAAALAGQVVSERRAAGRSGATAADVWGELARAVAPAGEVGSSNGRHDPG
jgi:hypothetical protein